MLPAIAIGILLSQAHERRVIRELIAIPASRWIQKPTTIQSLHGKVVLLDFFDYTCNNCIRTHPYLKEWYRRYHDKGLEIVSIHTPEFLFEQDPANVRQAVHRFGFTWPVLNDPKRENWWEYGVFAWPTKIVLGPTGEQVLFRIGEGNYGLFEKTIQDQLRAMHPGIKLPPLMALVRTTDRPGAVCRPVTREIYTYIKGFPKHQLGFQPSDIGASKVFAFPPARQVSVVYLSGKWLPEKHFLTSDSGEDSLKLKYMAKEVNAVLVAGHPVEIEVLQDGKPVGNTDLGDDLKLVSGHSLLTANGSRMYSVVKNRAWGNRELEFRVKGTGLHIYSFSFATDCAPTKP
jgi:thiol-disulfide isomerase/thioredoxin